jgi:excisionase family DNA binding protein
MTGESLTLSLPGEFLDQVARRVLELLDEREQPSREPEAWLTVDHAAAYLSCGRQRIYNLVSQGRLRHVKDGTRVLTRRQWLDEHLEAST